MQISLAQEREMSRADGTQSKGKSSVDSYDYRVKEKSRERGEKRTLKAQIPM